MISFLLFYGGLAWAIWWLLIKPDPPQKLSGVYSQPGKWFPLKYALFTGLLALRQRQNKNKSAKSSNQTAGYGVKSKDNFEEMDKVQKLPSASEHPLAVDAVYFNGSNKDGFYVMAATARRQKGIVQTALFLRVPGQGVYELPCAPHSHLPETSPSSYSAGGLTIECVRPMVEWKLTYRGKLKHHFGGGHQQNDNDEVNCTMDLTWTAVTDYFDFDTDMNAQAIGTAVAREPWSRPFFQTLQKAHQTHYEQFGDIGGRITINEKAVDFGCIKGMRDHSYGNVRDWNHFHRYTEHFFHLSDGTCVNVGVISMPVTMSRLEFGYVLTPNGEKYGIQSCDIQLHLLAEGDGGGAIPNVFNFNFKANNQNYHVSCEILDRPIFYLGHESEAKIVEQMARFVVNGQKGFGFAEWMYKNADAKPQ